MATATDQNEKKAMASDLAASAGGGEEERDEREEQKPSRPPEGDRGDAKGGFFHLYKPGQGYWTRMGTAGAAALIAFLTANFLYHQLPVWLGAAGVKPDAAGTVSIAIIGAFLLGFALLTFWLMNKPDNADFLIATDSEMKKVNWTSRKELIGSTKVVIIFMFLIAFMLFGFDIFFGYLFWFFGVLKSKPL